MFKDKYTSDVEKIKFDGSLKRYIKVKMRQEKTSRRNSLKVIGVLACLVCACLLATVIYTPENPASVVKPIVNKTEKVLLSGIKYGEIYDALVLAREKDAFIGFDNEEILEDSGLGTTGTASQPASSNKDNVDSDNDSTTEKPDHSTTNNQVLGVDETDIVKTDGEYIYVCKQSSINIAKATEGELEYLTSIELEEYYYIQGIFISENRLVAILSNYKEENTFIRTYDLTDKENPKKLEEKTVSGYYFNSRMIDNTVYLLTNYFVDYDLNKDDLNTYVPSIDGSFIKEGDITCINKFTSCAYLVIVAFDVKETNITSGKAFLGGAENIYCDNDNLYFTFTKFEKEADKTYIVKCGLSKNNVKIDAMGEVNGRPLNQFSMDEYEGNLRIVTTVQRVVEKSEEIQTSSDIASSSYQEDAESVVDNIITEPSIITTETITTTSLFVLDKNLKVIGKLEDLAKGERVYSVRFDGDIGYFVTFKRIDPLFTVDLKDPTKPTVLSELKIPGFSEYLHPFGEGKLFGFGSSATEQGLVTGLKISMFDVSNPSDVTEENNLIIESAFSEASGNHKAIMVDNDKNIIAFAAMSYYGLARVYVYEYDENGFTLNKLVDIGKAELTTSRFIWIGDYFYLAHSTGITSFDLENFNIVSQINF